jgi:hypothetical protein
MKFRAGLIIGLAFGYYYGAKAGQERYDQMRGALERVAPAAKLRAAVELGLERLRETAEDAPLQGVAPPSSN